jgi:hydroxysqualene dehydroxylase
MKKRVLVIGGGPAGLAAALRLGESGYSVTVLERRRELGGRLLRDSQEAVPVVIWGWHTATRKLLQKLGTSHAVRACPRVSVMLPHGRAATMRRPWLPGLLRVAVGIATYSGLPVVDRWRLLNRLEKQWERAGGPASEPVTNLDSHTALAWLNEMGQSRTAIGQIWDPLSHFLLGDETSHISAAAFTSTLWQCVSSRKSSSLALPGLPLRAVLLDPIQQRLLRADVIVHHETVTEQLRCDAQRVTGVQLPNGDMLSADWYVAAVPARQLVPLLPERAVTRFSYFQQLSQLRNTPALTIHLSLAGWLPARILLLSGRPFHWVVVRTDPNTGRTCVICVATGGTTLLEREDHELADLARAELARILPESDSKSVALLAIVRNPEAFLLVQPGTAALRPLQQSPFSNLFLAGDWTDTGIPPSLESALRSGEQCAEAIMGKATG